ncbi:MAG TPA: hypothetical protein DCS67_11015 [Clostridiales bacterium UBA8960]|nr:hypothetical protein [Clostridiales bacterium UBA8960]
MKKKISLLMAMIMVMSLAVIPGFGAVPRDDGLIMYATGSVLGPATPYEIVTARKNPANAYGQFDAIQNAGENLFYSLASHEYTKFTFADTFFNIEDTDLLTDMQFSEVTWGDTWHPEAALVFLTGAKIGDIDTNVPYALMDGGHGYFAGIIWNKVGIQNVAALSRSNVVSTFANNYDVETRAFIDNTYGLEGNFGITRFRIPEEVVSADGVILVDITHLVYNMAGTTRGSTYSTGEDGYDLDAIRVYGYEPPVISGTIDGVKYDLSGNPITDATFDFEIYKWVDDEIGDLVAKAQSSDGDFDFSQPGDIDDVSADNLVLPTGVYYIKEVNIPSGYDFVNFIIVDGGTPGEPQDNGAWFTIDSAQQQIIINAINQKLGNFKAFKFNGEEEGQVGFTDYSFDFVLRKMVDDIPMDYASGHSLMDGFGKILWDLTDTEEVEALEELLLPTGYYEMFEVTKDGFMLVGTKLITQEMDETEPTELPGTEMTVPFMVMEGSSIQIEYSNAMIYHDETAFAYFGESSITLNTLRNNNNWGWYIKTEDLILDVPYEIYAAAGQNILSNGVLVGTVTFHVMDNMYYYSLDFSSYPGDIDPFVIQEHLGVYKTAGEIPRGPGLFTNLVTVDEAGVIVLHLVVSIPVVMPE